MKKILLVFFAALASIAAMGQDKQTVIAYGSLRALHPSVSYQGKPVMFGIDWDTNKFTIYDDNFNVIKTIDNRSDRLGNMIFQDFNEGLYYEYLYFTQTLFNDDENFEFVVGIPFDSETYKGFNVVSEDGTILKTIEFEGGFKGYDDNNLNLVKINDRMFIMAKGRVGGLDADLIYEIDRQTSSIRQVARHIGMSVSPTVADRNDQITVELDEDEDASEILVVNSAGQTVRQIPLKQGQRQASFSAETISRGMNVVNVRGRNGRQSRKIIVK